MAFKTYGEDCSDVKCGDRLKCQSNICVYIINKKKIKLKKILKIFLLIFLDAILMNITTQT